MFRSLIRTLVGLAWLAAFALLGAPFLLSSLALDNKGITLPATVASMSETMHVTGGSWTRSPEIALRYQPPDSRVEQV